MSRELPTILNTEMVKAVLSGNKIQTRRPVKCKKGSSISNTVDTSGNVELFNADEFGDAWSEINPPCKKGDTLYVRETWGTFEDCHIDTEAQRYFYRADMDGDSEEIRKEYIRIGYSYQFKPSIHMPKKAARLFLKVTKVRAERLNDISEQDSVREGLYVSGGLYRGAVEKNGCKGGYSNPVNAFKSIWNSIYNNWDSNPWVWVIDFEVVKR